MERHSRGLVVGALALALVAAIGCDGDDGKGNTASLDDFFLQFRTALCKSAVACGDAPDVATCLATQQFISTEFATVRADVEAGKVRYDASQANACLQGAERRAQAPCTQSALAAAEPDLWLWLGHCAKVFRGDVAEGGACVASVECASQLCTRTDTTCSPLRQCCPGLCAAAPVRVPVGGSCADNPWCVEGAFCLPQDGTFPTCFAPSKVAGTPCHMAAMCSSPLFCDLDAATGSGTCQPAASAGASCNPDGLYESCDDRREVCVRGTRLCTPLGTVSAPCDPGSKPCLGLAVCVGGVCIPRGAEGDSCDPTVTRPCQGDLQCSPGTRSCQFAMAAGACL